MRKPPKDWANLEHAFLKACQKADIPFGWVDRALGRGSRSSQTHARCTGIPNSIWSGRPSFFQTSRLRVKFAAICTRFAGKGLEIRNG